MIDIVTIKGERYSFDPVTTKIAKDGVILSSAQVEPVYSLSKDKTPTFSGILLKTQNSVISMNGKITKITNSETL